MQFLPTKPRNKIAKYFTGHSNAIKKAKRKYVQHDNPDMECGNINAKNIRKVITRKCNKDKMTFYFLVSQGFNHEWLKSKGIETAPKNREQRRAK